MHNNTYYYIIMDKKSWFSWLHSLHNVCRQGYGIKLTGRDALNEITNFIVFKVIENDLDQYELDDKYKISNLYDNYCTDEKILEDTKIFKYEEHNCYKVWDMFCNPRNNDCFLSKVIENPTLKSYFFNTVNLITSYGQSAANAKTIQILINLVQKKFIEIAKIKNKKIEDITLDDWNFDAFGLAYEEFKTNEVGSLGKIVGQHFTPIDVKKYIISQVQPKYDQKVYEPACGTGGFIIEALNFVKSTCDDKDKVARFGNSICGNENTPEIYKPLLMNMLINRIPIHDTKGNTKFNMIDSLGLDNIRDTTGKNDLIVGNPPFGPGSVLKPDKYWGPLSDGKKVVKDFMSQFIMHIYNSLKIGGTFSIISDRGWLCNGDDKSWQGKLRKFLIENGNLYKIVLLPTGTFDYTNFATCIMFYKKGEPTKELKYYKAYFNDEKNKKDLQFNETPFKILTKEDIIKLDYILKPIDDEEEKNRLLNMQKLADIGYIPLRDICSIVYGKRITKDNNSVSQHAEKSYPVYGGGELSFYTDTFNREGKTLIISRFGVSAKCVRVISGQIYLNDSAMSLQLDNKNFLFEFISYYVQFQQQNIYKLAEGNAQKYIKESGLLKILIPNLTIEHQKYIIGILDEIFNVYDINKLVNIDGTNELFKLLVDNKYTLFKDTVYSIYVTQYLSSLKKESLKLPKNNTETNTIKKPPLDIQTNLIQKVNMIIKIQNELLEYTDYLQNNIDNIYKTINIDVKPPTFTTHKLNDICKSITIGTNIDIISDIKKTKGKILTPYYTKFGQKFCNKSTYDGNCILIIRTEFKQGQYYVAQGKFSASDDMIVIELNDNFKDKFDEVYKYIKENFNFKELIEKHPIKEKVNNKMTKSKNIGIDHLKNFDVKIKDIVTMEFKQNDVVENVVENNVENNDNIENVVDNNKKYTLSDICEYITIGTNIDSTNKTKTKKFNISYYTKNGITYCDKPKYNGLHILCVRTPTNQGRFYSDDVNFNVSNDIIIIKLKEEYTIYFDKIFEYLQNNFNHKQLIDEKPYINKNTNVASKHISTEHFKNFEIEIKF